MVLVIILTSALSKMSLIDSSPDSSSDVSLHGDYLLIDNMVYHKDAIGSESDSLSSPSSELGKYELKKGMVCPVLSNRSSASSSAAAPASPARSASPDPAVEKVSGDDISSDEMLSEDSDAPTVEDPEEEKWQSIGDAYVPGIIIRDFIPAHSCVVCQSQADIYCIRCYAHYCQNVYQFQIPIRSSTVNSISLYLSMMCLLLCLSL